MPPDRTARRRVLIEAVSPQVDCGLYAAKRVLGDRVVVSCDLVSDGHDAVAGALFYRHRAARAGGWRSEPLSPRGNDRFAAAFVVTELGAWEFFVEAWVDTFTSWRTGTSRKLAAGQDVALDLATGAMLLEAHAARANEDPSAAAVLREAAAALGRTAAPQSVRFGEATSEAVVAAASSHPEMGDATRSPELRVVVDPERARFSSWYELFPRSAGAEGKHGTLKDCIRRLPYVAAMGFDVLYLPPIHPIGRAFRKGPNNALDAKPNDVGSPWAIGAVEGGHKAVHPELGTIEDLRALVVAARAKGIEVALDIAFQASPDHPYVAQHPEWFLHRADGSIQYAENPPKKYQDVYPFDFEGEGWEGLWKELLSVFLYWCDQGVRVFRVDNPHTKPLRFWEWCIAEVKERHPEAIFLAEAFTRPKLMYALAKGGFSQSYTYFAWRHSKREFTEYLEELTRPPVSDFYRPNFWPNTPDILPENLQFGGRSGFMLRLMLAATLSSSYGIYGPAFELMEHVAREASEEYVDNEKYQLRAWNLEREDSLRDVIALVNRVRREQPALQHNLVTFHPTDDENILAFSKRTPDGTNIVLVVINVDPHHTHAATVSLDLDALGLAAGEAFQVHDVLADARYRWEGTSAFVEINPHELPASVFVVRRRLRTEQDFDYFL